MSIYPNQLVIDLGADTRIGSFRCTPRSGNNPGRIKDNRVHFGSGFVKEGR